MMEAHAEHPSGPRQASRALVLASALSLTVAFTLGVFGWPATGGGFYLDTEGLFRSVPDFRNPSLSWESLSRLVFDNPYPAAKRPLANLTFLVESSLFGLSPKSGRLVNLLLHGLNAGILFLLFRQVLLFTGRNERSARWPALIAAALWAVNPFHADSVFYIIQRMTLMSATFYLLGAFAWIRARSSAGWARWGWVLLLLLCFLAGLACKENVALLPLGLIVLTWALPPGPADPSGRSRRAWLRASVAATVLLPLLAVALLGYSVIHLVEGFFRTETREYTAVQRLMTEGRVLVHYLSLLFFPLPHRLAFVLKYRLSQTFVAPWTTAAAWGAIAGLLTVAVIWRKRQPLVSLAVLWFFVNHLMESTLIPLEVAFVHRNYLPSAFLLLPVVDWLVTKVRGRWSAVGKTVLGLVAALFILGWQPRATVWGDRIAFWSDAVEKAPGSLRGYINLGVLRDVQGQPEEALEIYRRGERLAFEETPATWSSLYCCMGIASMNLKQLEAAEGQMERALALAPLPDCLLNMAKLQILLGATGKATQALDRIEAMRPQHHKLHLLRARVALAEGNLEKAHAELIRELSLYPDNREARRLFEHFFDQ